jgi:hypothetical protein
MRVRMIIECEPNDLGRILNVLPSHANWHATRAPALKAESPVRKMVIDEMNSPAIEHKKEVKTIKYTRKKTGLKAGLLVVLRDAVPRKNAAIRLLLQQRGIDDAGISSRLTELIKDGLIVRSGEKFNYDYAISSAGQRRLQEKGL